MIVVANSANKRRRYLCLSGVNNSVTEYILYTQLYTLLYSSSVRSMAQTWRNHFPEGDLWVFGYGFVHTMLYTRDMQTNNRNEGVLSGNPHRIMVCSAV